MAASVFLRGKLKVEAKVVQEHRYCINKDDCMPD